MGKYGYYLNIEHNKSYSVPICFQTPKFDLDTAIKIIDCKSKFIKEEEKLETDSTRDYVNKVLAETHNSDLDDIVAMKNKKSFKKNSVPGIYQVYSMTKPLRDWYRNVAESFE